ncbi:MAG TPA: hypothetical protein VL481_01925 [Verrucomicrobiae bacterium]|jgi:hypothetical protein|nr:hypothetical protein [Verrucomicrobiae bacterium]
MSRKNIIILVILGIAAAALLAGGFAYKYYASFHKVTVTVQANDLSVDVYQQKPGVDEQDASSGVKQGTVKGTAELSLQAGTYFALPQGNKYDSSAVSFIVEDKDMTVTINPGFSEEYLGTLLQQELSSIKSVIIAKYPQATTNFTLNDGKLYKDGTWYGTTLIQNAEAGNNGDVYRTILHKVNGTWQFAATPEIILTAPTHKDIPQDILTDLNGQSGY